MYMALGLTTWDWITINSLSLGEKAFSFLQTRAYSSSDIGPVIKQVLLRQPCY